MRMQLVCTAAQILASTARQQTDLAALPKEYAVIVPWRSVSGPRIGVKKTHTGVQERLIQLGWTDTATSNDRYSIYAASEIGERSAIRDAENVLKGIGELDGMKRVFPTLYTDPLEPPPSGERIIDLTSLWFMTPSDTLELPDAIDAFERLLHLAHGHMHEIGRVLTELRTVQEGRSIAVAERDDSVTIESRSEGSLCWSVSAQISRLDGVRPPDAYCHSVLWDVPILGEMVTFADDSYVLGELILEWYVAWLGKRELLSRLP